MAVYNQISCHVCGGFAGAIFSNNFPDEPVYCATCAHSIIKLCNHFRPGMYYKHWNYIESDNRAWHFAQKAESVIYKYIIDESIFAKNIPNTKFNIKIKTT